MQTAAREREQNELHRRRLSLASRQGRDEKVTYACMYVCMHVSDMCMYTSRTGAVGNSDNNPCVRAA